MLQAGPNSILRRSPLRLAASRALSAWGALALLALTSTTARANDASFGGAGADLIPLVETRVRMQSEDIVIAFGEGRWHVEARYVFVNGAKTQVALQVGFPELRCVYEMDCAQSAFQGLATRVDGNPVEHRQGKLDGNAELADYLGVVWLYDVTFPPGKQVVVDHTYSMETGADTTFYRFTSYVTRTGTRWAGPIGRARFTVRFPAYAHTIGQAQGIESKGIRLVETGEGAPYLETTYESRNWAPQGDLVFSFNASAEMMQARLPETTPPGARCPNLFDPKDEEKAACRNLIYGARGFPFASEQLRAYFYDQGSEWTLGPDPNGAGPAWMRPPRMFDAFDASWIDYPDDGLLESYALKGPEPERYTASVTPEATPPPTADPVRVDSPPPVAAPRQGRCGCSVPGERSGSGGALGVVLLALLGARRPRTLRRSRSTEALRGCRPDLRRQGTSSRNATAKFGSSAPVVSPTVSSESRKSPQREVPFSRASPAPSPSASS